MCASLVLGEPRCKFQKKSRPYNSTPSCIRYYRIKRTAYDIYSLVADLCRSSRQLNLGVYNGLKAQRVLKAKYWVGTHDEVKEGRGLVGFFIKREVKTIKEALELEREQRQKGEHVVANSERDAVLESFDDTKWLDLRNGESRVLV